MEKVEQERKAEFVHFIFIFQGPSVVAQLHGRLGDALFTHHETFGKDVEILV